MSTRVVTAHIPNALAEKIDEIAGHLDRPRGWVVKQALTAWVELEEERVRLTREAMQDVDDGHVVDHGRVLEWAAGLVAGKHEPIPG